MRLKTRLLALADFCLRSNGYSTSINPAKKHHRILRKGDGPAAFTSRRIAAGHIELLKEPRMLQRPLLFVVMAACLSSSVQVWCQTRLHDGNRQDAVEAQNTDRHEPGQNKWRNVAESMPNLRASSQNRTLMVSGYLAQNAFEKAKPAAAGALGESGEVSIKWRGFYKGMACPDPRLASP